MQRWLVFRLWEGCLDCLADPGQAVSADDQDIFYPAVSEAVQYREPVFCAFIFSDLNRQNFFLPVTVDTEDDVGGKFSDNSVIPYRIMDRINKKDGIDIIQWAVLPFFDLGQNLIRNV